MNRISTRAKSRDTTSKGKKTIIKVGYVDVYSIWRDVEMMCDHICTNNKVIVHR
jgi:hypothetical protein